jgi:hypothetical protein
MITPAVSLRPVPLTIPSPGPLSPDMALDHTAMAVAAMEVLEAATLESPVLLLADKVLEPKGPTAATTAICPEAEASRAAALKARVLLQAAAMPERLLPAVAGTTAAVAAETSQAAALKMPVPPPADAMLEALSPAVARTATAEVQSATVTAKMLGAAAPEVSVLPPADAIPEPVLTPVAGSAALHPAAAVADTPLYPPADPCVTSDLTIDPQPGPEVSKELFPPSNLTLFPAPSPALVGCEVRGRVEGTAGQGGYIARVVVGGVEYQALLFSPILALDLPQ